VVGSENDSLQIKVDGAQSGNVRLTQKTYASGIELAVELQTRINEDSSLKGAGVSVDVSFVNNRLQIQSSRPGGNSQLEITGVGSTMSSTLGISTARGVLTIPAATQGILSGDTISSFPQTVDAGNNSLRITVDGVASGKISLLDNSYASGEDLATELEKAINSDPTLQAGRAAVKVGFVNDQLQILSARYGADSQVQITQIGTEGSGVLGGLKVASGIAGTGIQGQGQVLTATGGNASGLSLLIDGSQTGSRGTVDFSRGAIEPLSTILSAALDVKGIIASRTDGINKSITNITRQRTDLSTRMETYQRQLYIRFNAMDSMMGKLQATSTYLTQQITALNAANKQN
jgi:flagellar hook-associated protein 2